MSRQNPTAATFGKQATRARFDGRELFAAYVAHELRTPLAIQRALLELTLANPNADTASWRDVAEDVLDACLQQERLLEACLTLARSEASLARHDRIDLTEIAGDAVRTHDRNGLECVVTLEPASVAGDSALLERLAANLVSNAIRHNLPGGRIEVATCTTAEQASFIVANSGPVVSTAELPRLFQPFYQRDSDAQLASGGIGLGLPIVQAIAHAHQACLAVEALGGGGLRVDVRFPAAR